jgi:hypothetical protein
MPLSVRAGRPAPRDLILQREPAKHAPPEIDRELAAL